MLDYEVLVPATMTRFAMVALFLGCASPPPPRPAAPSAPLAPLARSSVAAVLEHRGELSLTDEQIQHLQAKDDELEKQNASIRDELAKKTAGSSDHDTASERAAGFGMRGGGGGRGGGQRSRGSSASGDTNPRAAAEDKMDDNDTKAYLDAEAVLTEEQKPRAREIASKYRQDLYDSRHRAVAP